MSGFVGMVRNGPPRIMVGQMRPAEQCTHRTNKIPPGFVTSSFQLSSTVM